MRRDPCSRRRSASAVVAAMVLVSGCTGDPGTDAGASTSERIGAIRAAREVVVEPAQALGTAAAEVAARLDTLVEQPDEAAVAAARGAVEELRRATAEARDLELAASTDDVRGAAAAIEDAADGAERLAAAVAEAADAVERSAAVADTLEQVVAGWDEPGSRSQLLQRFEELRAEAQELADGDPPAACPGPVREATVAAAFVAAATGELRDLVEQRDGLGFDERRAELDVAPLGTAEDGGPRRLDGPLDASSCPAVEQARDAAADVAAALRDLQDALNPDDLGADSTGRPSDGGSSS